MKQEDLAGRLGSTQSSVSGWINGKYEPSAGTVFAIEQALDLEPGFLSRPLGYLPVEAASAPAGVEVAITQNPLLDDECKTVLLSLYALLAAPARRPAPAPRPASRAAANRAKLSASPPAAGARVRAPRAPGVARRR